MMRLTRRDFLGLACQGMVGQTFLSVLYGCTASRERYLRHRDASVLQNGTVSIIRHDDPVKAIKMAIGLAKKNDVVIITGKGSEAWLRIEKGKKIPWNEREIVEQLLRSR